MQRYGQLWIAVLLLGLTLGFAGSCGGDDDDSDGGSAGSGSGEPCASPGYTQTGCTCSDGALGRRICAKNHYWDACKCPPVTQQCVEGEKVKCNPCTGETEGRITTCLQGGTYDCGCN